MIKNEDYDCEWRTVFKAVVERVHPENKIITVADDKKKSAVTHPV